MLMDVTITVSFLVASIVIFLLAEKVRNPIVIVHMAFFIVFVETLHLAGLFKGNHQNYDIVYYLLAHLSIFLYLVIFVLSMLCLKGLRLLPPQERFFKSATHIKDSWLIAAFFGWLLIKAYLVTKYGVSAFSLFKQMAGKDIILHYTAWWETPLEGYLRAFAMGASVVYVVKAVSVRGYWKGHWAVSLAFVLFVSINVGTHSSIIGPRRFMLMLVLIGLVTAAWREGKQTTRYLLTRWHRVLIAGLMLFGLAAYYQSIRNNFFQPEIANKLLSGNLVTFASGIGQGMVPISKRERVSKDAKMFRSGPLEAIYLVIERRNEESLGTGGDITANALRMITPRIITAKNKEDINADDFLEKDMSITPAGPYLVSDVATSLIAIFMADFGFIGVLIAPMVMAFSFVVFLHVPRKGLLSHPLMVLFFFSALLIIAANVEGSLVSVLVVFRDAIILGLAVLPLSVIRNEVIRNRKHRQIRKVISGSTVKDRP